MNVASLPRWGFVLLPALMLISGLAMNGARSDPAGAIAGAYVELHVAECPTGYDGSSLYHDCHENRLPAIAFAAEGAGGERYEGQTDFEGVLMLNDYYTAGPLTVTELSPGGDFSRVDMYCSTVDDQTALPVELSTSGAGAATFDLPQSVIDAGSGVICDWYYFSASTSASQSDALPQSQVSTIGLGLTRSQFEAFHGPGTPTQHVVMYEDGRYAVGYSSGVVTFIETDWVTGGGLPYSEAAAEVAALLPDDAELVQRYELPATPSGPVGVLVERYESGILATRLADQAMLWDGSVIVLYLLGVPSGTDELPVLRISIAAGSEATGSS